MKLKVFPSLFRLPTVPCLIDLSLFFCVHFQVYTAKSLSVGETFDDVQLQPLSDVANETIRSEIKSSSLPFTTTPRISSLFDFGRLMRKAVESLEDDINNEIENGDVIEIEVPVIGSEFMRRQQHDVEATEAVDNAKGYAEMDFFSTPSAFDVYTTEATRDNTVAFFGDFQTAPSDEAGSQNTLETATRNFVETSASVDVHTKSDADIQSVESKLMEQWKATDVMIDGPFESEMFTVRSRTRPKYPFNVKIVVNNEDEKKSCRSKTSCSQVNFARSKQSLERQFYADYSDEDLFFLSEDDRYFQLENEMRPRNARRAAADDMITPAPRLPPFRGLQGVKKPGFIERLENESSLERSERINKNLDGLMRFISVWAQVDKFVSERARSAIKRVAYLTGDDYDDEVVGSRKRVATKKAVDAPFT